MHQFIISGFGGQGVMSMGMMLAYAAMLEGKEVTWLPSYGPEMRGGTANCQVIVSDKLISSPIISKATDVIAMNLPSLTKFESHLKQDGRLFVNSSLIDIPATREDIECYYIKANDIAIKLRNDRVANMVMLGAVIGKTQVVSPEALSVVIEKMFSEKKKELIPVNLRALKKGVKLMESSAVVSLTV